MTPVTETREGTPRALTFSLTAQLDPAEPSDQDLLTCEAYRRVARELAFRLFETELQGALEGGLVPMAGEPGLEHHTLGGRFDRAVCRLKLERLGPSRFLLQTSFYLRGALVTTAVQHGVLDFEELWRS